MLIPVAREERDNEVQIYTGKGTKDNYLGCIAEPVCNGSNIGIREESTGMTVFE